MERLKMQSHNIIGSNIQKIAQLFPQCVTERLGKDGKPELGIDFEKLQAELSDEVIGEGEERYQFTWPDKRAAARLANTSTTMTLRPCREESVDFDHTQNLYIEGDNLDVLKVLRETYLGKVKMIYIDPPYNTGNDFVYNDEYDESKIGFESHNGLYNDEGKMVLQQYERNTESNGRFHTDWLNMMYPRLKVARDLLTDDGVIFISIDENEVHNMRKLTDEIFGESNFVSQLGWQKVYSPKNQAHYFSNDYEFILCYCRDITTFSMNMLPRTEAMNSRYKNPDNDPRGPWKSGDCVGSGVRSRGYYEVVSPKTGKVFNVPQGKHWVYAPENMKSMIADNRIWFGKDGNAFPSVKQFLSDVSGRRPSSLLMYEDYGHTDMAKKDIIKLFQDFEKVPFDTPKPVKLIKMLSIIGSNDKDIILDFFGGSGTTAQALFELNLEVDSKRKFIIVQINEPIQNHPEAIQKKLDTVSKVAKERIRRAGRKIKADSPLTTQNLDVGFRVLKLDSSNMLDVYYTPEEFNEKMIFQENVKADRTDEDLLFQVMLELGIELSASIRKERLGPQRATVFNVDDDYLMATFEQEIDEATITEIAKRNPGFFVMRDASAASDNVLDNFEQLFRHYSPETSCRII